MEQAVLFKTRIDEGGLEASEELERSLDFRAELRVQTSEYLQLIGKFK